MTVQCAGPKRRVEPWLVDYAATVASFDWDDAWAALRSEVGPVEPDSVNIADLAVDRHVREGRGDRVAFRFIGREPSDVDEPVDVTYARLATTDEPIRRRDAPPQRFGPGTGVASLTGRIPDLYVSGARHAQGARDLHTAVLGVRSGPDRAADEPRPDPRSWSRHRCCTAARSRRSSTACHTSNSSWCAGAPRTRLGRRGSGRAARGDVVRGRFSPTAATRSSPTRPIPRRRRSCTSRAARRAHRKERCTCTAPW